MTFYKNGDPYFPGIEFRFRPGRDVVSLESLLDKLSLRMDLPRGARFIFNMDGAQIMILEDLEDGGSYVVSSFKSFKVSTPSISLIIMKRAAQGCQHYGFSVEVWNSENDLYFSRFLYRVLKFSDFAMF